MPANSSLRSFSLRFLLMLGLLLPLNAMANFDFNANCLKAYQLIFELKLSSARQLIAQERKVRPSNSIVPLLENYADYFQLITSESKIDFDRMKEMKSKRLSQIADDNAGSPYYLYAQAEINLQWAMLRSRYGEYFGAAREIKKANGQLQENNKKYPGFQLNAKGLGLINVIIGSLPEGMMKSTLSTFGLRGNVREGLAMLERLAINLPKSTDEPFYEEVIFYYAYVLSDVVKSPDAYSKTMKFTARIADSSLLKSYLRAYVCSRNGHTDEAIAILSARPASDTYQSFPYLELLMGTAKLNKLDLSAALNFKKFLQLNKGVNYIRDANLHLAWISFLNGDTGSYNGYMGRVKTSGNSYHEKDKQALNEAGEEMPNQELLKARLLFDGGYYSRASALTGAMDPDRLKAGRDKAEYYYRSGRINDALNKDAAAIKDYQQAVQAGKNLKYYFAANSALLMGKIYAGKKQNALAKAAFNEAIAMKNHEYENSIESQAKEGLRSLVN